MKNFMFLQDTFINTYGNIFISMTANTSTFINLIDADRTTQWTSGAGWDANTSVVLNFTFTASKNVSRLAIRNHNIGGFRIFYDGVTANVFTPDINHASNTSDDLYFEVATQAVSSVQIQIDTTYPLNAQRAIGEVYIGGERIVFSANPTYENYNPIQYRKGQELELSDGGMVSVYVDEKFRADITLPFVSPTVRDNFKTQWDRHEEFYFIPWAVDGITSASQWDGQMEKVIWAGDFDGYRLSSNTPANGYDLVISLRGA